jgi:hypothetical protein
MPETYPPESGPRTGPALATPASAVQVLPTPWRKASVLVKVSATNPAHSEKNTQWSDPFRNRQGLPDRINPVLRTKWIAPVETLLHSVSPNSSRYLLTSKGFPSNSCQPLRPLRVAYSESGSASDNQSAAGGTTWLDLTSTDGPHTARGPRKVHECPFPASQPSN